MNSIIAMLIVYIIPTLIVSTIVLSKRRKAEKKNLSWAQSTNLKELIINAQNEGEKGHIDEDSIHGLSMVFVFSPLVNIFLLLMLLIHGIAIFFGYVFSKIPIK